MKIRMSEISPSGENFSFTQADAKLNSVLADLTTKDFEIAVQITPGDSFYQLSGEIKSSVDDVCSRCGEDVEVAVSKSFNDVLMEKNEEPRASKYSKGPCSFEFGSEVANYENDVFDLGEYLHEILALEIPEYPLCQPGGCPNAEKVDSYLANLNQQGDEMPEKKKGHPGFQALKDLKLN